MVNTDRYIADAIGVAGIGAASMGLDTRDGLAKCCGPFPNSEDGVIRRLGSPERSRNRYRRRVQGKPLPTVTGAEPQSGCILGVWRPAVRQ